MTNEIKLIALDLDGTLLNTQKEISAENRAAIAQARQAGVHVVLTTGRPLIAIRPYLEALEMLGPDDFSITFNGGLVQRNTGEILSQKSFSLSDAAEIKALTSKLGLPCDILSEATVYMTPSARPSLYPTLNKVMHFQTADLTSLSNELLINKIVSCTEAAFLDQKMAEIPAEFYGKYEIFKSQVKLLEFMPQGINKAFGLNQLIKILDLKPENVMAMGDEENDRSMIEWAGYGVAMGNAVAGIKQAARLVSDLTNDQNAVASVISHYVL